MYALTGKYPEETQWPCDCIDCDNCKYFRELAEVMDISVTYACSHVGIISVSVDDAGPAADIARSELCPSCDQKAADRIVEEWDRDNLDPSSEY